MHVATDLNIVCRLVVIIARSTALPELGRPLAVRCYCCRHNVWDRTLLKITSNSFLRRRSCRLIGWPCHGGLTLMGFSLLLNGKQPVPSRRPSSYRMDTYSDPSSQEGIVEHLSACSGSYPSDLSCAEMVASHPASASRPLWTRADHQSSCLRTIDTHELSGVRSKFGQKHRSSWRTHGMCRGR